MPDIQQIKSQYLKYQYSIPELLELSSSACLPFDLSKFTYEAARAGVIPSLDNCTMASRKSSASYNKAGNIDTASTSDILLFQGNRIVHPGRQPKVPPPVERQKDEGFARFLKKHASPTHNRVTAGGRIVPMEPRSPPVFALSSTSANVPQETLEAEHVQGVSCPALLPQDQSLENRQSYGTTEWPLGHAVRPSHTMMARTVVESSHYTMPAFMPHQASASLMHAHMGPEYHVDPLIMPPQHYFSEPQLGGPVVAQHLQGPPMVHNPYYSPSAVGSTVPISNDFGSSPAWSTFDPNLGSQDPAHNTYQLLVLWEQLYHDLDIQLKNIDRHRAMHQLDPYLADQRKEIVQRRSDAKDVIKECHMLLGLRRMTDSSQDSLATSFNVDAPAYVPARLYDSNKPQSYPQSVDQTQGVVGTDKPKGGTTRRAIPIISPPKPSTEEKRPQQAVNQRSTLQEMELDEWGVQNRPAPPEIHREQSRLSDMIQAEQRRSASIKDNISQHDRDSQPSVESQQGVTISRGLDISGINVDTSPTTDLQSSLDELPRDNADEMQKVMDAIGKPKGTITRVRLLDNRVIDVEGQGLSLSAIEHPPRNSRSTSGKADSRGLTPSLSHSKILRGGRMHATNTDQAVPADRSFGKENVLVAPQGHQKAATDAFLAQFNAVEDNVALATRSDNRSLHIPCNGLVEERNHSGNLSIAPNDFSNPESLGTRFTNFSLNATQDFSKRSTADQDAMSFQTATSMFADDLLNKGYSSVSVQNINAIGRLPQNLDGAVDARQIARAHLATVEKAKSPRLFKRQGVNGGGAWYGPFSREMFERTRVQSNTGRTPKKNAA